MTDLALAGHAGAFPMSDDARAQILGYIASTRRGMSADLISDETIRDIETAIGDQLQFILDAGKQIDATAVKEVLERFGPAPDEERAPASRRAPFLCRIEEGKQISGLCLGLATRADIRVDWLRTIAVILGLFSGGLLVLVYLAAIFFAPRVQTVADYRQALEEDRRTKRQ
jgi:phage shock protein C